MSGSRARAQRTGPKAVRAEVLEQRCATGISNATGLALARKRTHDMIIAEAGSARRSPVRWTWWSGERALEHLELLVAEQLVAQADNAVAIAAEADQMRELLVELGDDGYLVLAIVDVAVPRAFVGPS